MINVGCFFWVPRPNSNIRTGAWGVSGGFSHSTRQFLDNSSISENSASIRHCFPRAVLGPASWGWFLHDGLPPPGSAVGGRLSLSLQARSIPGGSVHPWRLGLLLEAQPVTSGSAHPWRLGLLLEAQPVTSGSAHHCRLSPSLEARSVVGGSARHCRLGPSLEAQSIPGGSVCCWRLSLSLQARSIPGGSDHPWRLGLLLEAQSVTGSTGGAGNHLQPRMPLVRPGCFLYLWPTVCKSEGPTDSSSGFNNLIKWLTELREAFYLQHWVTKEGEKKVKAKSLSRVRLFVTPWTVASEVPPSMEFSRQEYWCGLPFPSPFYLQRWVTSA